MLILIIKVTINRKNKSLNFLVTCLTPLPNWKDRSKNLVMRANNRFLSPRYRFNKRDGRKSAHVDLLLIQHLL